MNALGRRAALIVAAVGFIVFAACEGDEKTPLVPGDSSATQDGLHIEITTNGQNYSKGQPVHIRLLVENTGQELISLEFRTTQRFEFQVLDEDGDVAWTYSAGRTFAQVLGTVNLGPGESVEYSDEWRAGDGGRYIVRGWLTTINPTPKVETGVAVD